MRITCIMLLFLAIALGSHGCSSSSSAQGLTTTTAPLNTPTVENLTPLGPNRVIYTFQSRVYTSDYVNNESILVDDMTILREVDGGPGLAWNGLAFLINADAMVPLAVTPAEIWITDGTPSGTVLLDTLNPALDAFEFMGVSLDGDALVVAYRRSQIGVPSVGATFIARITL